MSTDYEKMSDRELDAMVAERVMGWKWRKWAAQQIHDSIAFHEQAANVRFLMRPGTISYESTTDDDGVGILRSDPEHEQKVRRVYRYGAASTAWHAMEPPNYTTDPSAWWAVVEKMRVDGYFYGLNDVRGGHLCEFDNECGGCGVVQNSSIGRAICIAALRALDAQAGGA